MRYDDEVIKTFNKQQEYRAVIPDSGTTVSVAFWTGTEWREDSTISSPDVIYARGLKVKLTPSVGGFEFDSAGAL